MKSSIIPRFSLYFLAVWIMFGDGQIWKYPQAGQWSPDIVNGRQVIRLENSENEEVVATIPCRRIKKLGFFMSDVKTQGYHIYRNPLVKGFSQECEVIQVGHMRVIRDDTGKTFGMPATIMKPGIYGDYPFN